VDHRTIKRPFIGHHRLFKINFLLDSELLERSSEICQDPIATLDRATVAMDNDNIVCHQARELVEVSVCDGSDPAEGDLADRLRLCVN